MFFDFPIFFSTCDFRQQKLLPSISLSKYLQSHSWQRGKGQAPTCITVLVLIQTTQISWEIRQSWRSGPNCGMIPCLLLLAKP